MKIMAIDFGDARTGIAISDITGSITGETMVVQSYNPDKAAGEIVELVKTRNVERIVLGYPRNMDGTAGPRAEKSAAFSEVLKERTGLEVVLWDERRTTIDAHRILTENSRHGKKRKEKVDAVAASLILEGYLGFLKNQ
ncbi:MAG: Holliday junction resolvase RuvX [Ruminococcaceae bacterium]|nr:Holliday junction resolvase RuvX [Oscillospiraceae bacterium]